MNKLVKGSIAGAAGIALLLGGAGTLAYWNDIENLGTGGVIATGTLDIAPTTAGTWTGDDVTFFVPGDSAEYTESFTITAVGDNLAFDLSTNISSLITAAEFDTAIVTE